MEVIFIGASVREGISAKNGRPYEIGEVSYAVPDEPGTKKTDDGKLAWTYSCHGYRVQNIDLSPEKLSAFSQVKPLSTINLDIQPKPSNPRVNWVIGVVSK
jgi:hypothetical protein